MIPGHPSFPRGRQHERFWLHCCLSPNCFATLQGAALSPILDIFDETGRNGADGQQRAVAGRRHFDTNHGPVPFFSVNCPKFWGRQLRNHTGIRGVSDSPKSWGWSSYFSRIWMQMDCRLVDAPRTPHTGTRQEPRTKTSGS